MKIKISKKQQPKKTGSKPNKKSPKDFRKVDAITYAPKMSGSPVIKSGVGWSSITNEEIIMELNAAVAIGGVIAQKGYVRAFGFQEIADTAALTALTQAYWIQKFGRNFDKFKVTNLEIGFKTAMAKTASGAIAMRFDSDPSDVTPDTSVRQAASGNMYAIVGNINSDIAWVKMKPNQLNRLPQYDVNHTATAPTSPQTVGTIRFVHNSVFTGVNNTAAIASYNIGNVFMRYTVVFYNPSNA